jgi:putative membrane protein
VTTLVVCLYRTGSLRTSPPVVGESAIEALITEAGVDDPEDSRVNCLLEGLRVARDLGGEVTVAAVSTGESVSGDRKLASQVEELVAAHEPESAVVVVDSAEDERLVPIVESRVQVDAVDRIVVRQARDIESTYYLLKQFLADEELRKTILVPVGVALLAFPALLYIAESTTVALASIAAVVGLFLLYKGLSIDDFLANLSASAREAMYAGQVSLVTYVVAAGLALVGVFVGVLSVSSMEVDGIGELLLAMQFTHDAIPWVTAAALTASAGRLLDEFIRDDDIESAYVNLPFVAIAVGLAIRGFAAYFLQRSGLTGQVIVPEMAYGPVDVSAVTLAPGTHLAVFVLGSIVVSLIGVRVAAYVSGVDYDVGLEGRRS